MSGRAIYRRWRSQTFDQVIAQEHVTRTLQNALRGARIAHAYLFTGPRGTGKTSTARILAKAANCLAEPVERPCNCCPRCQAVNEGRALDLIEIDAASNRGIDEIRDLRDKIAFAPNEGRYKVYVIDEVHMLTPEAFNALLKTLEEPPGHVIFVLATTEPQRIPDTILSRCQRFDFRRIPLADLGRKIERICQAEGIAIQPAAVSAIARRAAGSFRDAESLLDQLAAYGEDEITTERVQELVGGVSSEAVADLADAWIAADLAAGLRLINRLVDGGTNARQLQLELIEYLRELLLLKAGGDQALAYASPEQLARMRQQAAALSLGRLADGLRTLSQSEALARGEVRPQLPLEMAFVQAVLPGGAREEGRPAVQVAAAAPSSPGPAAEHPMRQADAPRPSQPAGSVGQAPQPRQAPPGPAATGEMLSLQTVIARWPQVLQLIRARSKPLEAVLRSGRPCEVSGTRLVLEMEATFHRDRVMEERNRLLLQEVLQELLGTACQVECTLVGKGRPLASRDSALEHQVIQDDRIVRYAVQDLGAQVSAIDQASEGATAQAGPH